MVNVWLGRAMTYDIVVSEIERLHAGGMPGCLLALPMMSASRALGEIESLHREWLVWTCYQYDCYDAVSVALACEIERLHGGMV